MEEELKKEIKSSKINSLNEDLLDMKPKKAILNYFPNFKNKLTFINQIKNK